MQKIDAIAGDRKKLKTLIVLNRRVRVFEFCGNYRPGRDIQEGEFCVIIPTGNLRNWFLMINN
jgi:hypothetical protein